MYFYTKSVLSVLGDDLGSLVGALSQKESIGGPTQPLQIHPGRASGYALKTRTNILTVKLRTLCDLIVFGESLGMSDSRSVICEM